jgi:surface antigen
MYAKNIISSLLASFLLLGACSSTQGNQKQTAGTILGAGVGALIGSQIGGGKGNMAAIAVGTLAGAWAGSEVGKSLDKADKTYAGRSAQDSLEYSQVGQTSTWQNPDSGHSGAFTPTSTYKSAANQDCREFETTVNIDGREEKATGYACRQADGTWKIETR